MRIFVNIKLMHFTFTTDL